MTKSPADAQNGVPRNRKVVAACLCISVALVGVVGWACLPLLFPGPYFELLAKDLRQRTVPPKAMAVKNSEIDRADFSISAHWEFVVDSDWESYATWSKQQLPPDFEVMSHTAHELVLRRVDSGDVLSLIIAKSSENPLRIRITLIALAS